MKKLTIIFLSLLFTSLSLSAQEVKSVKDSLEGDRYIPITRQQAEELISKIIIEARKPHIKARETERMVRELKIETLKRKLIDQALRDVYMDEYRERMDRLERMVMTLIMSQSAGGTKVDPAVIQNIITQGGASQTPAMPMTSSESTQKDKEALPLELKELIAALDKKESVEERVEEEHDSPVHTIPAMEIKDQVFFSVGSHTLSDLSKSTLDEIVAKALINPIVKLELKGYASPEGNLEANNRLSEKRVNSVAAYLKDKGIAASRLILVPSGIDSMKPQKKYARRVEISTVR